MATNISTTKRLLTLEAETYLIDLMEATRGIGAVARSMGQRDADNALISAVYAIIEDMQNDLRALQDLMERDGAYREKMAQTA